MTDKTLKNLVKLSYNNDQLDQESIEQISQRLSRFDLKRFIRLLKDEEKKKEIFVTSAKALTTTDVEKIKKLFPEKRVVTAVDSSMINGVKIIENDEEYKIDLNGTFHDIIRFLSTND
jgi:F0F1-type ATP synthase delta subunit